MKGNVRIVFLQDIFRLPDNKLVVKAIITTAATRKGKPVAPGDIIQKLEIKQHTDQIKNTIK